MKQEAVKIKKKKNRPFPKWPIRRHPRSSGETLQKPHIPGEAGRQPLTSEEVRQQTHTSGETRRQPHTTGATGRQPLTPGETRRHLHFPRPTRRQKYLLGIDLGLLLVVLCLYVLFFVPRDAASMFQMALYQSQTASCRNYRETLTLKAEQEIDAEDVDGLEQLQSAADTDGNSADTSEDSGTESLTIPVEVRITANCGEDGRCCYVVRKTSYTVEGKDASVTRRYYQDGAEERRYTRSGKDWVVTDSEDSGTVRVLSLLSVDADVLDRDASLARSNGKYEVTIAAADAGNQILEPFLKDSDQAVIQGGNLIYTFDFFSHRLSEIRSEGLVVTKAGEDKETGIMLTMKFRRYGKLEESDWKVSDEIADSAVESEDSMEQSEQSYTLSAKELQENEMECYVAGQDIPAGKYQTGDSEGTGIITCLRGTDATVRFTYNVGYNYYRIDNYKKGKEVTLREGDRILLSGDELSVTIIPAD